MYQFGFIGMGNMGSAMLKGCLSVFPASTLAFSRKDAVKGKALSLETGAVWFDSNRACAEQSRYIILAVKPQFYDGVLKEIQPVLDDSRIIISLAPSYTIADLKQSLGASARIIRAMPNTPAMVGEGMTGLSWSEDVFSDTERQELMQFFTEQLMDSIEGIEKSLKQIDSQQYILNINGIYDEGLRKILGDYSFEFYAAKLTLGREYDKADFWKSFDAIKQDLINYIYNWVDIRYYNYCRFKPYKFHDDKSETMRAMLESENK